MAEERALQPGGGQRRVVQSAEGDAAIVVGIGKRSFAARERTFGPFVPSPTPHRQDQVHEDQHPENTQDDRHAIHRSLRRNGLCEVETNAFIGSYLGQALVTIAPELITSKFRTPKGLQPWVNSGLAGVAWACLRRLPFSIVLARCHHSGGLPHRASDLTTGRSPFSATCGGWPW